MTEQLKAEAYVREQRPALMELTRGCVFTSKYNRNLRIEFTSKSTTTGKMNPGKHWEGILLNKNGKGRKCKFPVDTGEIIGHPINLQDWLAVLEKLDTNYHLSFEGQIMEYNPEDGTLHLTGIWFDMDTGQPATEADFKIFNEIVSV